MNNKNGVLTYATLLWIILVAPTVAMLNTKLGWEISWIHWVICGLIGLFIVGLLWNAIESFAYSIRKAAVKMGLELPPDETCFVCGEGFESSTGFDAFDLSSGRDLEEYCSKECYDNYHHGEIEQSCNYCGDSFTGSRANGPYCSNSCARTDNEATCRWCGAAFNQLDDHTWVSHCSTKCREEEKLHR